jgi:methyl-accepting chemotaxis protein
VHEVSQTAQAQATGVSQVTSAMSTVEAVTQRNASAAEELSSTAEEVASQASSLQQLVSFFVLDRGAAPERPAPRAPAGLGGATQDQVVPASSPRRPRREGTGPRAGANGHAGSNGAAAPLDHHLLSSRNGSAHAEGAFRRF